MQVRRERKQGRLSIHASIHGQQRTGSSKPRMRLWRKSESIREMNSMSTHFESMLRLHRKLAPLVKWYFMGSTLVVMGTALLTWSSGDVSGQDDLLMLFLAGILMLTFLFCIPLAIMNYLSKDYFFTAAVGILAFFMVRAHSTVMDTLGAGNIQMQACMVFLGLCIGSVVVTYSKISDKQVQNMNLCKNAINDINTENIHYMINEEIKNNQLHQYTYSRSSLIDRGDFIGLIGSYIMMCILISILIVVCIRACSII